MKIRRQLGDTPKLPAGEACTPLGSGSGSVGDTPKPPAGRSLHSFWRRWGWGRHGDLPYPDFGSPGSEVVRGPGQQLIVVRALREAGRVGIIPKTAREATRRKPCGRWIAALADPWPTDPLHPGASRLAAWHPGASRPGP